jgi:hypothetical protein
MKAVRIRLVNVAALGLLAIAALPATASAAQRFAAPGGSGTACTEAVPCGIVEAVNNTNAGDEVIVAGGTYNLTGGGADELTVTDPNTSIHGAPGAPPRIVTNSPNGLQVVQSNVSIRDLVIEHTGSLAVVTGIGQTGIDFNRIQVRSVGSACSFSGEVEMRNSICHADATGGQLAIFTQAGDTVLKNVTAATNGVQATAIGAYAAAGQTVTVSGANVIAFGGDFPFSNSGDIRAAADPTGTATIELSSSNFDVSRRASGGGTETVPAPGSATNQTAPPSFRNFAAGDFHQALGSVTIDAGNSAVPNVGDLDVDGEPRLQGAARDIGADEIDNVPPDTTITGGPSGETTDSTPDFTFTSSEAGSAFQCEVDGGGFGSCGAVAGQTTLSGLTAGPHVFSVRSIDPTGNVDGSPATSSFTIVSGGGGTADTDPPETSIRRTKVRDDDVKVTFRSDEPGSTFECKLDRRPFRPCTSPRRVRNLDDGRHRFKVRAIDAAGNTDPSAARSRFEIDS